MARASKLTLEKQATLCAVVGLGASLRGAARMIDVSESSIRSAAKCNPDFGRRLQQAELQREVVPLNNLREAATKHWRAAAWILERTNPEEYGRRTPDTMTRAQSAQIIESLVDVVANAVRQPDDRREVLQQVGRLCRALEQKLPFPTLTNDDSPRSRSPEVAP